jgi:hypothetical protein
MARQFPHLIVDALLVGRYANVEGCVSGRHILLPSELLTGSLYLCEKSLIQVTRLAAAASIAGGMIAASQRPHSVQEAAELTTSCFFQQFPTPGNGRYDSWTNSNNANVPHT